MTNTHKRITYDREARDKLFFALEICLIADFNNRQLTNDDREKFTALIKEVKGRP